MASGSIKRHKRVGGIRWEVVVELGMHPETGRRRQASRSFKTQREAKQALTTWLAELDNGTAVEHSAQTVAELLQEWLETEARHHVRPHTWETYEATIRVHMFLLSALCKPRR